MLNTFREHLQSLRLLTFDSKALRHLIRVMRKHDLANKKTKTTRKTMTMTNTFREHHQRATFETFDLSDIWSERWENMTWPTKRQQQRRRQIQWRWQIHLENTPNEGFLETFWEHPRMAIQEKFWVWPIIHCYEFSQTLSDQTDGGWQNFTIAAKFHNLSQLSQSWNTWNTLKYPSDPPARLWKIFTKNILFNDGLPLYSFCDNNRSSKEYIKWKYVHKRKWIQYLIVHQSLGELFGPLSNKVGRSN